MKLGVNTHFIMKFDFDDGLDFCRKLGVQAMELASKPYSTTSTLASAGKRFTRSAI
jgi:hypothetical protein